MNTVSEETAAPLATPAPHRESRYNDAKLRRRAVINRVLFALNIVLGLAYLVWAVINANYPFWYASVPYLFAECIAFGSMLLWGHMMMERREHSPRGLAIPRPAPPVDVIVTCCGEPFSVLERTLRAAAQIYYPDFKVTVADDRCDPAVGALCAELGFTHLCRPTHENRKAGNLNYALSKTGRPFILTLDADQVPKHTILKRLMGYFKVPTIGFVTTYQMFEVPEGDPWSNRDEVFYGAMQTARNSMNAAISCGSGVVYRRAALENIGGFATWNLVEDLYSSLLMHAAGWKSVYHHYPATVGTAPEEIGAHVKQRWQWAVDSCRLIIWRNPLLKRGLTWHQRLSYLGFGYNYLLFGIAYPIFFLLPILGLLTGQFIVNTTLTDFLLWRVPYFLAFLVFNRLITEGRHTFKAFCAQTGLFEVYFNAIFTALFSRTRLPRYAVTSKVPGNPSILERVHHVMPHLILIALNLVAILYGFGHRGDNPVFYWVNSAWALWVIMLLVPFTVLALRGSLQSEEVVESRERFREPAARI